MANEEHLALLCEGVEAWNEWCSRVNEDVRADLAEADLAEANLAEANLTGANLYRADLSRANLYRADLSRANLSGADLSRANLSGANLSRADLYRANLSGANLSEANLTAAHLYRANLYRADLSRAYLSGADLAAAYLYRADLTAANLAEANLTGANLSRADLSGANLSRAQLVETIVDLAIFSGAHIYGVAAWNLKGEPKDQNDLVITSHNEPVVTVDDLEVAQFMYLMLRNEKLRRVIDTITSRVVLILGRFTEERKPTLDLLRAELRYRNLTPVVFDFDPSEQQSITDTVSLLARMAFFVIIDLTDPRMTPMELGEIADYGVPIQPLIVHGQDPIAGLAELQFRRDWLLPLFRYRDDEHLVASLDVSVIRPADEKRKDLTRRLAAARSQVLGLDPNGPPDAG